MSRKLSLGRVVAFRRKQMGLTQEQLAEKIGVSKSAIAKWETDGGIPDRKNFFKLAAAINISAGKLHGLTGQENNSIGGNEI